MIDRQQVNLRLERELVDLLDDLARTDHVDRTEIARRILVDGVARARIDRGLRDYAAGRVTAWKAARDAGVSLYEMLDKIHEARIPYELDPEELVNLAESAGSRQLPGVAERSAGYGGGDSKTDDDPGIDELRERYRPRQVKTLFVGESSPAQGTHFYRADSNLFRATRSAFADALGQDAVPDGEAFLRFFRDQGCLLVDLASEPVNRERGVKRLAKTMRDAKPAQMVAVKKDIESAVRRAMALAEADMVPLLILPFPVRQWTPKYVSGLRALIAGS